MVALLRLPLLCLVVLLSPAQAGLIITIAPDGSGNARMLVTGSGSTTSTTLGNWDNNGSGGFNGNVTANPFNNFFSGALAQFGYTAQDFEIDGFQVSAGTQTRTLDRFTFDDDTPNSGDDFSLAFGNGTAGTTWDTDGAGVGAISVPYTAWQTIRFIGAATFANSGEALVFTDNFNVGTYTFDSANNVFWGGSLTDGITLTVSSDVIPEPTSALLLLLPSTALLRRKRFC